MSGYIRLHRGWMEHPVFGREPFTRAQAWAWLIEHAAWRSTVQSVGRHHVRVERGQLAVAVRYLAEVWQWSKSSVDRFLTRLETGTMIGTQAGTQYSIITICNYCKYQGDGDTTGTQAGTDAGTRVGHDRDKEERREEDKNISFGQSPGLPLIPDATPQPDPFDQFWSEVPLKVAKGAAQKAFRSALKKAPLPVLIDGIHRYAEQVKGREKNFIAHPSSWLNGERWLDDMPPAPSASADLDREFAEARAAGPEALSAFIAKRKAEAPKPPAGTR